MENLKLAGVGKRIVAIIIDWVVLLFVQSIIGTLFFGGVAASYSSILSGGDPDPEALTALLTAGLTQNFIMIVIYVLYDGLLTSSAKQGTLGKMAMKIKVVDGNNQILSQGTSFLRSAMKLVSGMICCIGYIVAFFNKEEQSLHDLVAKTYVVNE